MRKLEELRLQCILEAYNKTLMTINKIRIYFYKGATIFLSTITPIFLTTVKLICNKFVLVIYVSAAGIVIDHVNLQKVALLGPCKQVTGSV